MSDPTSSGGAAHRDRGAQRLLAFSWGYRLLRTMILRPGSFERYVRDQVRPFSGCRILDIGCGPADVLGELPTSIGAYVGFDMNPDYIDSARRRWGERGRFHCARVESFSELPAAGFDIVLATAILHHLSDESAIALLGLAHRALVPGGRLLTYDNVWIAGQPRMARWLNSLDRGRAIRTTEAYVALAERIFPVVEATRLDDTLRVPYTIIAMECTKGSG
jgi:SAM-dependent methyltransferase